MRCNIDISFINTGSFGSNYMEQPLCSKEHRGVT